MTNETIESFALSATRLFAKCERCKARLDNGESPTVLLGGYDVWLCLPCRNIWTEYLRESTVYDDYCDSLAVRDMFLAKGHRVDIPPDVWLEANRLVMDIRSALFNLAREWVEAGVRDGEG